MKKLTRLSTGISKGIVTKALPMRKPLQTLEAAPDPIEGVVDYTDDVETDAAAELSAVQAGFRDRAKAESERFKTATGSNFYFCVVFDDGDQADAFLTAVGVGKSEGDQFVDGRRLSDRMGITIPESKLAKGRAFKIDTKLTRLSKAS